MPARAARPDRDRGTGRGGPLRHDRAVEPVDLRHRVAPRGGGDAGRLAAGAVAGPAARRGGVARPGGRDPRRLPVGLRRGGGPAAATGPGVPGRGRGASDDSARGHRDEHRDRRCAQPRLEAGLGDPRLGGEPLLDSYEAERAPVGRANAEASMHTAVGAEIDPLAHDFGVRYLSSAVVGGRLAGRRAPHAWVAVQDRQISTLDLFADRLTLLTGPDGERWRAEAAELADEGSRSCPTAWGGSLPTRTGRSLLRTGWVQTVRCWSGPTATSPGTARTPSGLTAAVQAAHRSAGAGELSCRELSELASPSCGRQVLTLSSRVRNPSCTACRRGSSRSIRCRPPCAGWSRW